jgi:hypothetical protein
LIIPGSLLFITHSLFVGEIPHYSDVVAIFDTNNLNEVKEFIGKGLNLFI